MAKLFVSNKDESFRMFDSDFLEIFTKINWYVPLIIYIPVVLYFLYAGIFVYNISIIMIITLFISGLIVWTLTEYVLHRFVFHFHPRGEFAMKLHFMFHGVHHDYPQDSKRLVMPPIVSGTLAVVFYLLFDALMGYYTSPFFSGFVAGYLFYDIIHYSIHHFNIKNKFILSIKAHHMKHHYLEPNYGFGVSQNLWDYVFGTQFNATSKK